VVYQVTNFYQFVSLDETEVEGLCRTWEEAATGLGLTGTVLVAAEGVNAALAGAPAAVAAFLAYVGEDARFAAIKPHVTTGATLPFRWLEVKRKRWIIRFAEGDDPPVAAVRSGGRISPAELREALGRGGGDVTLIDTRNTYEVEAGRFAGAVALDLESFTDFPAAFAAAFPLEPARQTGREFVFYCTGGIRCEKAVAWAEGLGYRARQLDGGILGYLRESGGEHFDGRCFVFDGRRVVDGTLAEPPPKDPPPAPLP
jgi:UPF0176 protein